MTDEFNMTEDEQDTAMEAIKSWVLTKPGLIGPYPDRKTVELEAFRLCHPRATTKFFIWHLSRVGYVTRPQGNGWVLDVSDPSLIMEA